MIILLDDIHKQEYNKSRSLTVALGLDWSINNSSSADSGGMHLWYLYKTNAFLIINIYQICC